MRVEVRLLGRFEVVVDGRRFDGPVVRLPSNNHILRANEPAFATFIDEVERFVSS